MDILITAMKKRNLESLSPPFPDSKKLNHSTGGVESPKRVGLKKLKQNLVSQFYQFANLTYSFWSNHLNSSKEKFAFLETREPKLVPEAECGWANHQR